MITDVITYPSKGGTSSGYLALPEAAGQYMGVVIIQEWWGLNAHIQDVTRRAAGAGAVALAPDLYHGRVTTEPDEARKEMMNLDRARAVDEISGAVDFLVQHEFVFPKKIGVVGFCMGGALAQAVAAVHPAVGACVAYYGGNPPTADAFVNRDVAILSICGEEDTRVTEAQTRLGRDLRARGMTFEQVVCPGCDHAFFNDARPEVYQPAAAQDAWAKTIQWFRTHLSA